MIVTTLGDVVGSERDVHAPTFVSRRFLLAQDGMGFSFHETIIRSRFRLTYREAQDLIESRPPREDLKSILWELQALRRLAKVLRRKRAERGSLDFDLPEAIVELDEEGFPVDIQESVPPTLKGMM